MYVVGNLGGSYVYGFLDDGELNGIVGKFMFNVLIGLGIGEIMVVVICYFGGIKFGIGGLVCVYGGSLNNVMCEFKIIMKVLSIELIGYSDYSV